MYIPGRLRTASSPSRTLMFPAPYARSLAGNSGVPIAAQTSTLTNSAVYRARRREATFATEKRDVLPPLVRDVRLQSHRHDDVRVFRILRPAQVPRPDLIGETELDHLPRPMHRQYVEHVSCVETD